MNRPTSNVSSLPLTLDPTTPQRGPRSRVGASAEPTTIHAGTAGPRGRRTGTSPTAGHLNDLEVLAARPVLAEAVRRAARSGYPAWLAHVEHVGSCSRPIRLRGRVLHVDPATGTVLAATHTRLMPDGVIYTACGNRRAASCPGCSATYRADTFHLIRAGLVGGKTVPDTVRLHPVVFLTATAPSFGPVHSTRAGRDGHPRPCRPRRLADTCPHGRIMVCRRRHENGDPDLGQPFCLNCYDHAAQVVWNVYVGELWRRTLLRVNKTLKAYGARASFAKVAEMQARGVVHLHALIRLDALDPELIDDASGGWRHGQGPGSAGRPAPRCGPAAAT